MRGRGEGYRVHEKTKTKWGKHCHGNPFTTPDKVAGNEEK